MALQFPIQAPARYAGETEPVKRPKEFACFSYDKDHKFRLDDSSLKWYYPPEIGSNLSDGYDTFIKHDDSTDEHLDSLLKAIADHEQQTGGPIDAHIVTWRGMLTKIMGTPYDDEGFEMNATLYRDCIFIEENHAFKEKKRQMEINRENNNRKGHHRAPPSLMQYWGYKFETLSTIPRPWGETTRDYIENRNDEVTNNKEQYCSVVRTGFGKSIVCLGGEVDAIWDAKPETPGQSINWVELKTTAEIHTHNDRFKFDRKLMRYWIQSFLLGVPKIIVGFRTQGGILSAVEEFSTLSMPQDVQRRKTAKWDGNVCIKFASLFLDWLRQSITEGGVWRIRRENRSDHIELFKVEEVGHGSIITDEFMNWRIKLSLNQDKAPAVEPSDAEPSPAEEPVPEPAIASGA